MFSYCTIIRYKKGKNVTQHNEKNVDNSVV